jgi:hypothetical protein
MPASYPTNVKTFTTRNSGDAIQPSHVNDLQDEVTAIETDLLKTWSNWAPAWTNLTVGNGTTVAKYFKLGPFVFYELRFVLGTTSSVGGAVVVSLPVNAVGTDAFVAGHGEAADANGLLYQVHTRLVSVSTMAVFADTGTSAVQINTTVPFVWADTDGISIIGFYEAAA